MPGCLSLPQLVVELVPNVGPGALERGPQKQRLSAEPCRLFLEIHRTSPEMAHVQIRQKNLW